MPLACSITARRLNALVSAELEAKNGRNPTAGPFFGRLGQSSWTEFTRVSSSSKARPTIVDRSWGLECSRATRPLNLHRIADSRRRRGGRPLGPPARRPSLGSAVQVYRHREEAPGRDAAEEILAGLAGSHEDREQALVGAGRESGLRGEGEFRPAIRPGRLLGRDSELAEGHGSRVDQSALDRAAAARRDVVADDELPRPAMNDRRAGLLPVEQQPRRRADVSDLNCPRSGGTAGRRRRRGRGCGCGCDHRARSGRGECATLGVLRPDLESNRVTHVGRGERVGIADRAADVRAGGTGVVAAPPVVVVVGRRTAPRSSVSGELLALCRCSGDSVTTSQYEQAGELRRALQKFTRETERIARKHGLTSERYLLLLFVRLAAREDGGATVSDLAESLFLAKSTVTQLTRRAEDLRLIRRELSDRDARIRYVRLTEEGERRLDATVAELGDERAKLLKLVTRSAR